MSIQSFYCQPLHCIVQDCFWYSLFVFVFSNCFFLFCVSTQLESCHTIVMVAISTIVIDVMCEEIRDLNDIANSWKNLTNLTQMSKQKWCNHVMVAMAWYQPRREWKCIVYHLKMVFILLVLQLWQRILIVSQIPMPY